MTIQNETYDWLNAVSAGLLSKRNVQCLQLPDSTELNQLQYLATRLQPQVGRHLFSSLADAQAVLTTYFSTTASPKAKVSSRSDRAIEALLLVDSDKRGVSVNPWSYGLVTNNELD